MVEEHGLTNEEYERIVASLGREPNFTELGIFSVMWSEHCSYKSSRTWLKKLPTTGKQVIQGPGENAGIIEFSGNLAIAFKMESHNHPSFIEPYQGAATGVGGILRDVFTMGARPIANLNSLRFGSADHKKTPHLVNGVVAGIGGYGNCVGVPTVGGEVFFDPCFNGNILVNAMTVGLVRKDAIFFGTAEGVGNPVIYVGSKTGRDGIHGATMASDSFDEASEEKRPTVQVGDPFIEKLLLEACLEAMATGAILGIQDMGAAGLTSSSFEMASRSGSGLELNLDKVPQREANMTAYELLLSESQERMLMVVQGGRESEVLNVFTKWDLDAHVVGTVTNSDRVQITMHNEVVADLPVAPVVHEAPIYMREQKAPQWLKEKQSFDPTKHLPADKEKYNEELLTLLGSPNMCSRAWVYSQYDHQVMTGTVVLPGSDAAVLRVKDVEEGIALSTDCNSRYCYLDPYWGAAHAVAEAARNLACSGAQPQAVTDCLNFGNPERPEIMWQFVQAVDGMGHACRELNTPVVSGNVSLYNETNGQSIYPTPQIGMVGILKNVDRHCTQYFKKAGDIIVVLGNTEGLLGASTYLYEICGEVRGRPQEINFAQERGVQQVCISAIEQGILSSAHDISDGGLAVAIAESAITGDQQRGISRKLGAEVSLHGNFRKDELLFGEGPARILVSLAEDKLPNLAALAEAHNVEWHNIGVVGGDRLRINSWIDVELDALYSKWAGAFESVVKR